jgi:protocatechuate 3,4-dioxygenase, beta subunit
VHELLTRRQALRAAGAVGLAVTSGGILVAAESLRPTVDQTSGPFYPQPEIAKQPFHDDDLVRKMPEDEPAKGQVILVDGTIRDVAGKPIQNAVVEIWQACTTGRYNHARDTNTAMLDEQFQYWGRVSTDQTGGYSFRTIRPGEYPGRTAHIHYRVLAPEFRPVVTQMYFENAAKSNARDGIYNRLEKADRDAVTVAFAKGADEETPKGTFDLVLAAK